MAELPIGIAGGGTGGTTVEAANINLSFLEGDIVLADKNGNIIVDKNGDIITLN